VRLLRRGTRWPRCGWPAIVIHRSRPRCVLGSDPGTPCRGPLSSLNPASPHRPPGRPIPAQPAGPAALATPSGPVLASRPASPAVSSLAPRTCSGAAFIKFQVSAPAQITASNSGSSWLGPSKSAAVPVNTENAPPWPRTAGQAAARQFPAKFRTSREPLMSTWIRVRVREVSVLAHGRGLSPFHVKPCRRPAARIAAARRILSAYAWSSSVHVSLHTQRRRSRPFTNAAHERSGHSRAQPTIRAGGPS